MKCMKDELSKTDMSEDEILEKTKALIKIFSKDEPDCSILDLSLVSKQPNSALRQAEVSPKDFAKVQCKGIGVNLK